MKRVIVIAAAALICAPFVTPARALGPVDAEIAATYWSSDVESGLLTESSKDAGGWAEVSLGRWAFAASRWQASPEGSLTGVDPTATAVDVKYRVFNPSSNNFIALGVGGAHRELLDDDTTVARVVAEGRFSVKVVYVFLRAAYLPSLSDIRSGSFTLDGDKGAEADAGVAFHPAPFFYLHAGYRQTRYDFTDALGDVRIETKGPYAGLGFKF